MLGLANGVTSPAQTKFRLPLAEAKRRNGLCHEPPPLGTAECYGCLLQQGTDFRRQFHLPPPPRRWLLYESPPGELFSRDRLIGSIEQACRSYSVWSAAIY